MRAGFRTSPFLVTMEMRARVAAAGAARRPVRSGQGSDADIGFRRGTVDAIRSRMQHKPIVTLFRDVVLGAPRAALSRQTVP